MTAASTRNQFARAALAQVVIVDRTTPDEPGAVTKSYAIADAVIAALGASTFTRDNMAAAAVLALTDFQRSGNTWDDAAIASAAVSLADLMVASSTGPDVPPGGGGGIVGTDANSIVYMDPTGTNGVTDPNLTAGQLDAFARPCIRDKRVNAGRGAIWRNGSWPADGDPGPGVKGEGYVTIGANSLGNGPDASDGAFFFATPASFGIVQILNGVNGNNLFYACGFEDASPDAPGLGPANVFALNDDAAIPSFAIDRLTGAITQRIDGQAIGVAPTRIAYAPGAPAPLGPLVADTWAGVMRLVAGIPGEIAIACDSTFAPVSIGPAANYDMLAKVTIEPLYSQRPDASPLSIDIVDGAQVQNLSEVRGHVRLTGHGTAVPPLGFTVAAVSEFRITGGAQVVTFGAAPVIDLGATGTTLNVFLDRGIIPAFGKFCNVGAGDRLSVEAYSHSVFAANVLTVDAAGTVQFEHDYSVGYHTQAGDASGSWDDGVLNEGQQRGTAQLVAGVSPFIPVPGLHSGSSIVALLRIDIGGAATTRYAALDADRVYGPTAGGFKLTALAGAAVNLADGSDLDWSIVP